MTHHTDRFQRFFQITLFLFATAIPCLAQDTPSWELFGGYSIQQSDVRTYYKSSPTIYSLKTQSPTLPGWNVSLTENLGKWYGGSLDVGGYYKTVPLQGIANQQRQYSILYGPRVFHRTRWFTPFAHVMVGAAKASVAVKPVGPHDSAWAFALAAGGGVDLNLGKKAAIRLAKVEYYRADVLGIKMNSFRGSAGIVLFLGQRK